MNALIANFAKATVAERKAALKMPRYNRRRTSLIYLMVCFTCLTGHTMPVRIKQGFMPFGSSPRGCIKISTRIRSAESKYAAELARVVGEIISQFRNLIEKNDLADLLWHGSEPRHEKAAQLVFFAVADAYCRANDIDISPETDSGGGPVDFKFSQGYGGRYLVEVKLSTGRVAHGYSTQLEVYKDAAGQCEASFLVVDVGGMGRKLQQIRAMRRKRIEAGEGASAIELVDAKKELDRRNHCRPDGPSSS